MPSHEKVLPETREGQVKLLEALCDQERGGQLNHSDLVAAQTRFFGERARAVAIPKSPSSAEIQERTLSSEQIEVLVGTLRDRFSRNKELHQGIVWADVEKALRASSESLWSLQQLEATGGEPDVLQDDGDAFRFSDFSKESPTERRNVVFDAEAEAYLQKHYPGESCNGNAAERVAEWGVEFMSEQEYHILQQLLGVDAQTRSWLRTTAGIRNTGNALDGDRIGGDVRVHAYDAGSHRDHRGFRCSLRVKRV